MTETEYLEDTRMRSPWRSVLYVLGIIAASALATWAACQPTTPT